ncbi:MAG: hypothetical protein JRN21_02140 [Nitrososphaerota archaeon]|nr:hypothetical protein [Nitrososphaerota archaeon]
MQRLSVISVMALLAIGCVLAGAVFIHPLTAAPSPTSSPSTQGAAPPTASNSTLLTQPPATQSGGDDGGGGGDH